MHNISILLDNIYSNIAQRVLCRLCSISCTSCIELRASIFAAHGTPSESFHRWTPRPPAALDGATHLRQLRLTGPLAKALPGLHDAAAGVRRQPRLLAAADGPAQALGDQDRPRVQHLRVLLGPRHELREQRGVRQVRDAQRALDRAQEPRKGRAQAEWRGLKASQHRGSGRIPKICRYCHNGPVIENVRRCRKTLEKAN